ncbi:hypothetical protein AMATHDRAFT_8701 [Amanita thiersii Skay4041]|uniref:Uncharacterized protein n=1 Tax=Amanita thiersii Skay4041 TaxID=703135 RepID=A0A2A9N7Y5_9AGAR|nr:hypothetical protein AMATHDRAFT_8701 [Amanita thiersii Skay4041]
MQTPSTNSGLKHGTSQSEDAGLNTDNSLSTWFKKRIGALHGGSALPSGVSVQEVLQQGKEAGITTPVGRTFEAEFDEVFAPDARIVMNHVEIYKKKVR